MSTDNKKLCLKVLSIVDRQNAAWIYTNYGVNLHIVTDDVNSSNTAWMITMASWWLSQRRQGFRKDGGSSLACPLVAVDQSNAWCADPPALWTSEGLGWGWLGGCSLFLPPVSVLGGFCLSALNLWLAHQLTLTLSLRPQDCCHDWWLIAPVQAVSSDSSFVYLDLHGQMEWMILLYSLLQSSKGAAGLKEALVWWIIMNYDVAYDMDGSSSS